MANASSGVAGPASTAAAPGVLPNSMNCLRDPTLESVSTPAALVDWQRMQANIARMQSRMNALGVAFRPHVKTAKCLQVAALQQEAGAMGITVSTLKEAEIFFKAGFTDILYAVCMVPTKLPQALALCRQGCALTLVTDSIAGAQAIADYGRTHGHVFKVWIEVDTDGHRSGVKPDDKALLLGIARTLEGEPAQRLADSPQSVSGDTLPSGAGLGGAVLGGVMTHAGSSYSLNTPEALAAMAEQERSLCVAAAQTLRQAGYACPAVSVGSTPTALNAQSLAGVTEVRAGVYVFFDLVMANVGVCSPDDIALSVLATVIGHQADKGWVIVDAGWMAMSRDRGTQKQSTDYGYGQVCDVQGHVLPGVRLTDANQEHGIVTVATAETLSAKNALHQGNADAGAAQSVVERFPLGLQLRILPNHACATGAQFPEYQVLMPDHSLQTWSRFHGW
jgi:threo-3-hydroxy-D-aspartate ammonia-lyase